MLVYLLVYTATIYSPFLLSESGFPNLEMKIDVDPLICAVRNIACLHFWTVRKIAI